MLNRQRGYYVVFLALALLAQPEITYANPFAGSQPSEAEPVAGFMGSALAWIEAMQAAIGKYLRELLAKLAGDQLEQYLPHAVLLSLAYGVLHALGPGHAKTVIASYFLAQPGTWRKALASSLHVAVAHVASAIVIVVMLYYVMLIGFGEFDQQTNWISRACYAVIMLLGAVMLFRQIAAIAGKQTDDCCDGNHVEDPAAHGHAHPHRHGGDNALRVLSWSAGVVPCPGPILAMLFMAAQGKLWLGVALAAVMALGMSVTIFLVAIMAGGARKLVLAGGGLFGETSYRFLFHALGLLGAVLVLALGALLLWSTI